jgi:hypothetical protein
VTRAPMWFVASIAVAVIALIAGVGVAWTANGSLSDRDDRDELRSELIGVAERFYMASNAYEFSSQEQIADYKSRLRPMMTDEEYERFLGQLDQAIGVLGLDRMQATSTGAVRQAAVEVLDDDSATVMVTGDVEFDSARFTSTSHPRWEISLRLVEGEWLVDRHTELGDGRIFTEAGTGGG